MATSLRPQSITKGALNRVLAKYTDHVPDKLKGLDEARYKTIPEAIARLKAANPRNVYLSKADLESLVEWKLKHGTFRPKLLSLVSSNSPESIEEITGSAFAAYSLKSSDPLVSLVILTRLKGIGPATASLLLSVYDPQQAPFFSDELFRYLHWEEQAGAKGWARPIKYSPKEYASLFEKARTLLARLGDEMRAVDLEKAAYVLGKEDANLAEDAGESGNRGVPESAEAPQKEPKREVSPKTEQLDDDKSTAGLEPKAKAKASKRKGASNSNAEAAPAVRRSKRHKGKGET